MFRSWIFLIQWDTLVISVSVLLVWNGASLTHCVCVDGFYFSTLSVFSSWVRHCRLGKESGPGLSSCPEGVLQLAGHSSSSCFHGRTQTMRGLGIFIEARTPIPVILHEIIHLKVGRASEKGLWALVVNCCGCGQVN